MEFNDVLRLFRESCEKNSWGSLSYIRLMDDGSGEVVSEDEEYEEDLVFDFFSLEDLITKLEKSKK